jgi:L-lysine 2,3-aminomutase
MIARSTHATQSEDWRHALRHAISDPRELLTLLGLDPNDARASHLAAAQFPLRVPHVFAARMRRGDWDDPLLRQVLPLHDELLEVAGFSDDAVGDLHAERSDGLLQKYAGRALMITTAACAIHCRYCFRRHFPYAESVAARDNWAAPVQWLRTQPTINEVILSGGDPLSLATHKLRALTDQLAAIPHIQRLRIHTRWPVVLPARVDAELVDWISSLPLECVVVIHANHGAEFDADVSTALAALRAAGAVLLNQAVLLRGVNDSVEALAGLSRALIANGVVPYYLHLLDRVHGSAHFEVSESVANALMDELKVQLPGFLVPRLARESAGERSKTFA